jgi:uncharacterized integral membrane protein
MSTETTRTPVAGAPAPRPEAKHHQAKTAGAGRSRLGSMWVSLIGMALAFAALLIFVLQNPARTDLHFLWLDGRVPLGVAMLFAAIAGILLVAIPGTGRILQLRRRARRHRDG